MASVSSSRATAPIQLHGHGLAGNLKVEQGVVALGTSGAGTALNDTVNMFTLPKGAIVRHMNIKSDDLDSNGAPAITWDVGDASSATRFFSASTVSQAGGVDSNMQTAGYGYQYTADTPVFMTVHAAAATKQAGSVILTCYYEIGGLAD